MKAFIRFFRILITAIASLFIFSSGVFATGTISGVVTNCFTGAPVAGATVTITPLGYSVISAPNGSYTLVNIPAGNYIVSCSIAGFITQQKNATVNDGQTTVVNFCMQPLTAHISGVTYNTCTGQPIVGAIIWATPELGSWSIAYSTEGGHYSLELFPGGNYILHAISWGLQEIFIPAANYTVGNNYTINFGFNPGFDPATDVTASFDPDSTQVILNWGPPMQGHLVVYDDGIPDQCTCWAQQGNMNAVKFTPNAYPASVHGCQVYVCDGGSGNGLVPFQVAVYDNSGPGGLPGNMISGPFDITPSYYSWNQLEFPFDVSFTSGSYYIVMIQGGNAPDCAHLAVDTTTPQFRSYQKNVTGGGDWVLTGSNFMIRSLVYEPNGTCPPLNYKVWRLHHGEENSPNLWACIYVTTSTSCVDNSWPVLPCDLWLWAVTAQYPGSVWAPAALSNYLPKCFTADLHLQVFKCCPSDTIGFPSLTIQYLDDPDTVFTEVTDSTGTAYFNSIWKGHYHIYVSAFGCKSTSVTFNLQNDTTISIIMDPPPLAPTNIFVNDQTLLATWNSPENNCQLGYSFSLNGILSTFLTDTVYQIPPTEVTYGQTYTACVEAVYTNDISDPDCYTFTSHFLYPPLNFMADSVECSAELTWEKPVDLGTGTTPVGLLGYNIYRDSVFIHFNPDPDSLQYYDNALGPGSYNYQVTSFYDLSSYGFAGDSAESYPAGPAGVQIICGPILPFSENWENGTFYFNNWQFDPDQGNWSISVAKSSSHVADFSWQPFHTNYSYTLFSEYLDATVWTCSNIWLDFDLKFVDNLSTGTEKLTAEIFYDNAWHPKEEYSNTGSFDWTLKHIDISEVIGKGFRLGFRAYGANSQRFVHWYIDNINAYGICKPPLDLTYFQFPDGAHVNLNWNPPDCQDLKLLKNTGTLANYDIYRTDSTGISPYNFLASVPPASTTYTDILPPLPQGAGEYGYFVTALFSDELSGDTICESAGSDTIHVGYPAVSAGMPGQPKIKIYPNPAGDRFMIESSAGILEVGITSVTGKLLQQLLFPGLKNAEISSFGLQSGIYLITIRTDTGTARAKVVIAR